MEKVLHLIALFLSGCIGSTLLSWVALLNAETGKVTTWLFVLVVISLGLLWLLDDPIVKYLKVDLATYRAVLIGFKVAFFVGVGVTLWTTI